MEASIDTLGMLRGAHTGRWNCRCPRSLYVFPTPGSPVGPRGIPAPKDAPCFTRLPLSATLRDSSEARRVRRMS